MLDGGFLSPPFGILHPFKPFLTRHFRLKLLIRDLAFRHISDRARGRGEWKHKNSNGYQYTQRAFSIAGPLTSQTAKSFGPIGKLTDRMGMSQPLLAAARESRLNLT